MADLSAYYEKNEQLKKLILKKSGFAEAIPLALELHAECHLSEISGSKKPTYEDAVWDVSYFKFSILPQKRAFTLAWHIWHLTRIEDLVGNILIRDKEQIYNEEWHAKLGNTVVDTGNAMTDPQVKAFSEALDIDSLRAYRIAVGKQTRATINALTVDDMKRKPKSESLKRIMDEGGLTEDKGSFWLLDFWGKKTFAGLVLLPLTRHHMMHIEACLELKKLL